MDEETSEGTGGGTKSPCWLAAWFQNEKYTPMAQVIVAFAFGALLSPWGSGLFFLLVFILIYELLYVIFTWANPRYWQPEIRGAAAMASILGWIVGRTVAGDEVLVPGVPEMF